jgi:hypothetical protein
VDVNDLRPCPFTGSHSHSVTVMLARLFRFSSVAEWLACLPFDPRCRGSNPINGNGFLRAMKSRGTPSFGGEVKPEAKCCKILWHVKKQP